MMKCSVNVPLINCIVILILISGNVEGQQKSPSYYDFPPLYNFDDYDSCLAQKHIDSQPPIYCMVYAEVKPNNNSQLWQQMVKYYEEYPHRYRHDRLFFGVCIERCRSLINKTESAAIAEEYVIQDEITEFFTKVHKRPLDKKYRSDEHHDLIHNCLNREFEKKYNLNLRTFIEYCESSKEIGPTETKDPVETLLYRIVAIIFILNILSTLYDFRLKLQQPEENQTNNFYKINPQQSVARLLTSFSLFRNYYRLLQPNFSDVSIDLRFLDGFRSFCMILSLYGHIYLMEYYHIANPQYFEKSPKDEYSMWILNSTVVIEIYFVMSGLWLFIKFQQGRFITPQTSWKKFMITYAQIIVLRFLRMSPSVGLLMLVNATVLVRLQDGPFWRHIVEPIRVFSRKNGWRNLLMINNFSHKETASVHTWYLAADWQLFALYLLVIMIVTKYPKYKKHIYSSLAILSFVIPFSISYFLKLQPCFVIKPETFRYSFVKDIDVYYKIYVTFYSNLFGYLFGIICAEIYLKYTRTEEVRKWIRTKPLYAIIAHTFVVLAFLIFWLGVKLDVEGPSLWSALYAGLHRNLWILFICGGPLLLMSCNLNLFAYEFCCLPIFRILARLSFQVYIWHMTIIYLISGYQRQPHYINSLYFFTQYVVVYTLSNAVAFIIALLVEYPLAQSLQVLQSKRNNKGTQKSK